MAQRIVIPGFRKIETSGGGGEGGTTNYNELENKPSINNVPLVGNLNTVNLKLTDATLTEEGIPAEAKTVGKKLEAHSTSLTALSEQLGSHTVKSDVPENAVFTDTIYDDTEVKESIEELNSNLDKQGYGENTGSGNLFREEYKNNSLYVKKSQYQSYLKTNIKGITKLYATVKLKGTSQSNYSCSIGNTNILADKRFLNYGNISIQEYDFGVDDDVYIQIGCNSGVDVNTFFENYEIIISDSTITSDTQYKPYIPSVKMLAEENEQQSTEMLDLKMIGWTVPRECPIQNEVSGNQFIQKVGRVIIDSSKADWFSNVSGYNNFHLCIRNTITPNSKYYGACYSTRYKGTQKYWSNLSDKEMCTSVDKGGTLAVRDNSMTLEQFKASLSNPLVVYYELATPITKTIDGNEVTERINDSLAVIGKCKNLLNPTLQTTALNGITCTNNGDGTYTLSGTSTSSSNTNFVMSFYNTFTGKCKLIGCPSGIDSIAELQCCYNGIWSSQNTDHGEGSILDNTNLLTDIGIVILPNVTVNNIVFKPMITTNLNATYDDFVPYTGDSGSLNGDVAKLKNDLDGFKFVPFTNADFTYQDSYKFWTKTVSDSSSKNPIAVVVNATNDNTANLTAVIRDGNTIRISSPNYNNIGSLTFTGYYVLV